MQTVSTQMETKSGVTTLISDKIDSERLQQKKAPCIMIKGSIQEGDPTFVNIYAPYIGAPKHREQLLTDIKGETDSNTIMVGDFNTSLTAMGISSRQKIRKHWP